VAGDAMKPTRIILQRLAFGGAIACLIGVAAAWARRPNPEQLALARYSAAACVSPEGAADRPFWNNVIALGKGQSIRIQSTGEMRSMFELAFSDEDWRRQVTTFWDYSYPRDARINRSTNTLWLVVSGGLGTLFERAKLYEYDLVNRTITHEFDLESEDLPPACATATLRSP
jgi:hypothetical protein